MLMSISNFLCEIGVECSAVQVSKSKAKSEVECDLFDRIENFVIFTNRIISTTVLSCVGATAGF